MLVLFLELRVIDFLKLFGIVIYLRFKKKNYFFVYIILCLKFCYNLEKIKLLLIIVIYFLGNDCFCFCE